MYAITSFACNDGDLKDQLSPSQTGVMSSLLLLLLRVELQNFFFIDFCGRPVKSSSQSSILVIKAWISFPASCCVKNGRTLAILLRWKEESHLGHLTNMGFKTKTVDRIRDVEMVALWGSYHLLQGCMMCSSLKIVLYEPGCMFEVTVMPLSECGSNQTPPHWCGLM